MECRAHVLARRLLHACRIRNASLIVCTLASIAGFAACVDSGPESPDGIDDRGVDGKADGSQLTECETAQVVEYLNEGVTAEALQAAGVHERAARSLTEYRDGADGTARRRPPTSKTRPSPRRAT